MAATFSLYNTRDAAGGGAAPRTPGVAVTGANTYYSDLIGMDQLNRGYHFWWTGTPTGVLTRWESDKEDPILTSDADWVADATFAPTNPAGAAASFRGVTIARPARWVRYKYVNSAGSGVLFGRHTSMGS